MQVRPTIAEIDLDALVHNLREVRRAVPPPTGILAAVKGDAYGHGAIACARALEAAGVDWFGVALVEEGRALRRAGVRRPILCLGGVGAAGADEAIEHDLTPVVGTLEDAERVDRAAARRRRPWGVHLKVDTGMGRLGVPLPQWEAFLDRLAALRWVRVDGLCTHFAESDGTDDEAEAFTREQGRRFLAAVAAARARGFRPPILHAANSGAILRHPRFHLDLVRPGLLLYGYSPVSPEPTGLDLRPVMTVRTRILVVRDLPEGVGVSYGRTWTTPRPSRIATIPVGYGDGYPRALSNRAEVLVRGRRCPVVGRVCMDLTMVDVTEVPDVEEGDEVVLLGEQGGARVDAWDLARWADTIPYEILARFSARLPRRAAAAGAAGDERIA